MIIVMMGVNKDITVFQLHFFIFINTYFNTNLHILTSLPFCGVGLVDGIKILITKATFNTNIFSPINMINFTKGLKMYLTISYNSSIPNSQIRTVAFLI